MFNVIDRGREVLFEHIREVFIIVDSAFGYVDANAYAKELFPELKNKARSTCISPELHYYFKDAGEEFCIGDRYFRKKVSGLEQGGKVYGYTLILTDETRDHQYIEELQAAKKKAEEANDARAKFMSNMSHEIRTPMNAIVGMTEIMLRHDMSARQKEYMESIKNSGDALLDIVNDILDFSKIESGKMTLTEADYMPRTVLNDLRMLLMNRIGEKDIELQYEIDDKIPNCLYGDAAHLRQVILNICNNAIKFTEKGYVKLRVEVKKIQGNSIELLFSVKDSGQGIRQENLEAIFESFQRVDTTKNRSVEGTGLGLTISNEFVRMMGGKMSVQSEYEEGSTFSFYIMQKIGKKASDNATQELSDNRMTYLYPGAKVLIVDDNELNLKVAGGLLEPLKMELDFAKSGMEAIEKTKNTQYDLIFMDHMMPGMDGVETMKLLHKDKSGLNHATPVVVLTANAIAGCKDLYLKEGFVDYISKPVDVMKLDRILRTYLKSSLILDAVLTQDKEETTESVCLDLDVKAKAQVSQIGQAEEVQGVEQNSMNAEQSTVHIDRAIGLQYCLDDELYHQVLESYLEQGQDYKAQLPVYYETKQWKEYAIVAHAIKSSSLSIGAVTLSDLAKEQEFLGKDENEEEIIHEFLIDKDFDNTKPVIE